MSQAQWIEHADFADLSQAVTSCLLQACGQGLDQHGQASLALAGGGTPMPIYEQFAGCTLDWANIQVMATDERWVTADHAASNHQQLRKRFDHTGAKLLGLVPEQPGKQPGIEAAMHSLAQIDGPFDACLLGMGGDGHFASLFPGATVLHTALDALAQQPAVTLLPDPLPAEAPFARVSLTLSRLLNSNTLLLVITGSGKRAVLERAMQADADPDELPIAALLRAAGNRLQIHWSP